MNDQRAALRAALRAVELKVMKKTEAIQNQLQNLPANNDEKIAHYSRIPLVAHQL